MATTAWPTLRTAQAAASVIHEGSAPLVPSGSSQNSNSPLPRRRPRFMRAVRPYSGCQR
jgi:hypothetical protein